MSQLPPIALSENLILYDSAPDENTAKVVLPGPQAPYGRVVLHLGEPRADAGLLSRDLLNAAGAFAVHAAVTKWTYALDPTTQSNATDNQIIRLQDGSLLASKNGYIWSDLNPRPAWFGAVDIPYDDTHVTSRLRNAVYLFQSTDGGASWKPWSTIDSAVQTEGKYGWPQPSIYTSTGWGAGGFDRTELYQDPWSGDTYGL
jgi:hypothetical protein